MLNSTELQRFAFWLGLHRLIASRGSRKLDLVVAMIAARIIDPQSKLATARGFHK